MQPASFDVPENVTSAGGTAAPAGTVLGDLVSNLKNLRRRNP